MITRRAVVRYRLGTWTPPEPIEVVVHGGWSDIVRLAAARRGSSVDRGLAHRSGVPITSMRVIVFFFGIFVLWIPYLIEIFLPKLSPSRHHN